MKNIFGLLDLSAGAVVALAAAGLCASASAEILVKDGQKVAFLGDSITAGGWGSASGYVRLVVAGLEANGVKTTPVPAGIGGHKSNQMLERLGRDVLSKKPDWMTLSCGVNDVWHGANGVPLEAYRSNITAIVEQCQAAGVKVVILTATVIGEDLNNDNNRKLAAYNDFLRSLAKEKKCGLADLNASFQEAIKASGRPGRVLTSDGVHMNPAGDQLMARGVLEAFGLGEAEMKKAQESWQDIAGSATLRAFCLAGRGKTLAASVQTTLRKRQALEAMAAKDGKSLEALLNGLMAEEAKKLLRPTGKYESFEEMLRLGKEKEAQATLEKQLGQRVEELLAKGQ